MKTIFCALISISLLSGCEVAVGITGGATGAGLAAGYATERFVNEISRVQPITVTNPEGQILAGPRLASPSVEASFKSSDVTLRCIADVAEPIQMVANSTINTVLACNGGHKARARFAIRPTNKGPSLFWAKIDTDAVDRSIACRGTFRQIEGHIDPFGVKCVEIYKAPCKKDHDETGTASTRPEMCVGDFSTALRVQFSPRRSDGAVSIVNGQAAKSSLRLWVAPLK